MPTHYTARCQKRSFHFERHKTTPDGGGDGEGNIAVMQYKRLEVLFIKLTF